MPHKYELILNEEQGHIFEQVCHDLLHTSFKKSPYPSSAGRPRVQYDKEKFIDLYLLYVFKEISKEELLELLDMSKTTFHKILKKLKEEDELPLYPRSELHRYDDLIAEYRFFKEINWS